MAIALVLAAIGGAAVGLVWQSSGWAEEAPEPEEGIELEEDTAQA